MNNEIMSTFKEVNHFNLTVKMKDQTISTCMGKNKFFKCVIYNRNS